MTIGDALVAGSLLAAALAWYVALRTLRRRSRLAAIRRRPASFDVFALTSVTATLAVLPGTAGFCCLIGTMGPLAPLGVIKVQVITGISILPLLFWMSMIAGRLTRSVHNNLLVAIGLGGFVGSIGGAILLRVLFLIPPAGNWEGMLGTLWTHLGVAISILLVARYGVRPIEMPGRCPGCGYDATGLDRCPECGTRRSRFAQEPRPDGIPSRPAGGLTSDHHPGIVLREERGSHPSPPSPAPLAVPAVTLV
ncbi:MAG: hypothetical protein AAFX79_12765 [Planctomycetota bacterium]